MFNGDLICVRNIWEESVDFLIELQLFLFHQFHDDHCCVHFADGTNSVLCVVIWFSSLLCLVKSVRLRVNFLASFHQREASHTSVISFYKFEELIKF